MVLSLKCSKYLLSCATIINTNPSQHTHKTWIFKMSSLYERLLLMQALIYDNKSLIDSNKEDFDDKTKKLREIIDKLIENVDHIFHQYWIYSQENDFEYDGLADNYIPKFFSQKMFVSSDLSPDLYPVQGIAWVFRKPSNIDPWTSQLQSQAQFFTPLSSDLEPDITKPTYSKILVSSDMALDLDTAQGISRFFREPSNPDPNTSRLWTQTRFVTPLSCDLKPETTKPISRNIFVSSDLVPDLSACLDSGRTIARVFREPFFINSSCHDFEKSDERQKNEHSAVATYGGTSKLYIAHICIYIFFHFTEKLYGT